MYITKYVKNMPCGCRFGEQMCSKCGGIHTLIQKDYSETTFVSLAYHRKQMNSWQNNRKLSVEGHVLTSSFQGSCVAIAAN